SDMFVATLSDRALSYLALSACLGRRRRGCRTDLRLEVPMSLAALWLAGSAAAYVPTLAAPPARPPVLSHALTADSPTVAAQQVRATRLVRPTVIDGVLHDLMWEGAERVTGFLQRDPNEGMAPTESTYVYVAYDDAALYIGDRKSTRLNSSHDQISYA